MPLIVFITSFSPSLALILFTYTVRVLSFTKFPATSHILSNMLSLVMVLPMFENSKANILYSSAVKITSLSLTYTLEASKSMIILPALSVFVLSLSYLLSILFILDINSLVLNGFIT